MPLLRKNQIIEDAWVEVGDDAPLPGEGNVIISLGRLNSETAALTGRNTPLGVLLNSDTKIEDVLPYLDRLSLIAIDFPKYRDGRGFTLARGLVEQYGFIGEIRAVGAVLPDQHPYLIRCGFTTVTLPSAHADVALWTKALDVVQIAYQPGLTKETPLSGLRRRIAGSC